MHLHFHSIIFIRDYVCWFFVRKEIAAHLNTIAVSQHSLKCPPGYTYFSLQLSVVFINWKDFVDWDMYLLLTKLQAKGHGKCCKDYYSIIAWSSFVLENCMYNQLTVIESSKCQSASRNSVVDWFSGLQTSMQWKHGHIRFHNIQPNDRQDFFVVSWNWRPQLLLLHMYTSC